MSESIMGDPCGIVETIQNTLVCEKGEAMALPSSTTTNDSSAKDENCGDQTEDSQDSSSAPAALNDNEETPKERRLLRGWKSKPSSDKESKNESRGLLRGWRKKENAAAEDNSGNDQDEETKEGPSKMAAISDLSDLSRKICVVTTAGLPWRTGTAVNPLARALYLTRGRPKYSVTLMIPWLESADEQKKVYGTNTFDTPEEQEEWIRNYSKERIFGENDGNDEVDSLVIRFYPAKYHTLFGSIFATVDICALIPSEEADVAILEEPEHLTWFRSLPPGSSRGSGSGHKTSNDESTSTATSAMSVIMDNDSSCGACITGSTGDEVEANSNPTETNEKDERRKLEELAIIGWTAKFSYVVGILHTNYSAYMKQYGLGASIVTASALQALSSVCARAYTHKLIRLSDTLPELDRTKEITCNVHGVRSEFFVDGPTEEEKEKSKDEDEAETNEIQADFSKSETEANPKSSTEDDGTAEEENHETETSENKLAEDNNLSEHLEGEEKFVAEPIYFIGKVIWAKGFDKLLDIEELYRKETGDYFPIDVYGSGGDFDAISRAFLGRSGLAKRVVSSESVVSMDSSNRSQQQRDRSKSPANSVDETPTTPQDQTAALLFSRSGNLRGQIEEGQTVPSNELVVEVQTGETASNGDSPNSVSKPIMSHLGEKTLETGTGVTKAIAALSEKLSKLGLLSLYREESQSDLEEDGEATTTSTILASKFRFDPPKSRYELRRHSIPARFLGVKDHAILRDIPGHKIFINLSITEVLCTTTAEAMAMGKFVIIPKHPSNTFFLQFPNCLAYTTKKECVQKIKFALENEPKSLSPHDKHKLTWEGANARLFESSLMSEAEAEERNKKTATMARLHMDTMKTGAFFQGLWSRGSSKKLYRHYRKEEKHEHEDDDDDDGVANMEDNVQMGGVGFCKI